MFNRFIKTFFKVFCFYTHLLVRGNVAHVAGECTTPQDSPGGTYKQNYLPVSILPHVFAGEG